MISRNSQTSIDKERRIRKKRKKKHKIKKKFGCRNGSKEDGGIIVTKSGAADGIQKNKNVIF